MPEQQAISSILGALDDKIELNRRMNETLEAMARSLFQSWFVDFDPVRAKMEGRAPVGMDAETAALFPCALEDSVLGEIPHGWKISALGEIANNLRRGVQPADMASETPYIGLEHMPRRSIVLAEHGSAGNVNSNKFRFVKGDILFGKLRPYFHKVGVASRSGVCSTDILVIAPKEPRWHAFALSHLSSDALIDFANSHSDGTRMPRTNWGDLARYSLVLPTTRVAEAFNSTIAPMVSKIHRHIEEIETLTEMRDTLLPKLMSGEVRVREAEKTVEAAI